MAKELIAKIDHLSHHFGKQQVLDNISLSIPTGSIYGFLGLNGAGKTTTLRLLLGLLKKQTGQISLFNTDLIQNRVKILSSIGALIEQPSLYLHLSGKENLEISRLAYQCSKKRIKEVLDIVGLATEANKKVKSYSLGMKQRLSIANALLNDPDILILDEPTNGLDPNGIIEIRNLLTTLHTRLGKTIIISSHLLAEIEKIATIVGIIHKGKILFQGSLQELNNFLTAHVDVDTHHLPSAQNDLESLFVQITSA